MTVWLVSELLVKTIARRGYRFLAAVRAEAPAPDAVHAGAVAVPDALAGLEPFVAWERGRVVLESLHVGAFDAGMSRLHDSGLLPVIEQQALQTRVPVLGICLGMQLMTASSEEGQRPGLGWVPARTLRFRADTNPPLRVPHMGWNHVRVVRPHPLVDGVDGETAFYFVHSFQVQCDDSRHMLLAADYGLEFVAAFQVGNLLGVQFHPEKSHRYGMQVLSNFARMAA